MLVDGAGRRINHTQDGVKKALEGITSMVENEDKNISILYDENNGEINLIHNDEPVGTYDIEQIDQAIKNFLTLVGRDKD